jgi:hypothetical protein
MIVMEKTFVRIEFYRKNVYGTTLEYVKDPDKAILLQRLTGKKTITEDIRRFVSELSEFKVEFVEVIAP